MNRIIITGATSGIGRELALLYINAGWVVGAVGRNRAALDYLQALCPDRVFVRRIDVTDTDAATRLNDFIASLGGMDVYLHSAGVGNSSREFSTDDELNVMRVNGDGFVRMVTTAFEYFAQRRCGHIAVISSIAGTKGLGLSPAYSATKRMQSTYINALAQLSNMNHYNI